MEANGKDTKAAAAPPPKNVTALTGDQLQALHHHHARKIAAQKAALARATADLRNARKVAKADLGDSGLKDIDVALKLSTPEGEAEAREAVERIRRVAIWYGADIGSQLGLLDTLPRKDWRADGKRAGLMGEALRFPDGLASEHQQLYAEGWHEGQAVLLEGFGGKVGDTSEKPADASAEDLRGSAQKRAEEEARTGKPSKIGTEPSTATVKQ